MLLVLLRAVMAAREREDQRVIALQLAESAQCARVVGQLVVGKGASGHDVRAHDFTPSMAIAWVSLTAAEPECRPSRA
jgi:hypothetical protein